MVQLRFFLLILFSLYLSRLGIAQSDSTVNNSQKTTTLRKTIPFIKLDSAGERINSQSRFVIDPQEEDTPTSLDGKLLNLTDPKSLRVLNNKDSLVWSSEKLSSLFLVYFKNSGRPALPPYVKGNFTDPSLVPTWTKEIETNQPFVLEKPGLYFFQVDTTTTTGYGTIVIDGSFPKPEIITQVVDPLLYINTSTERFDLINAQDKRRAFENFWLAIGGNQANAKILIREFYRRVGHANRFYTSHKMGWKTDRGLIHIIFGPPNEIRRSGNQLNWVYNDATGTPSVIFEFEKKNDFFSQNNYIVVRNTDYQNIWNQQVSLWREGKI
jgi:GWxTD domain-containing protein